METLTKQQLTSMGNALLDLTDKYPMDNTINDLIVDVSIALINLTKI